MFNKLKSTFENHNLTDFKLFSSNNENHSHGHGHSHGAHQNQGDHELLHNHHQPHNYANSRLQIKLDDCNLIDLNNEHDNNNDEDDDLIDDDHTVGNRVNRVKSVKNSYTVNGDNRTGNKAAAVLVDIGLITDLVDSHGNNNDQELTAPTKTIKPKRYVRAANANRNFNSGSSRKVRLQRDDKDEDEDIPMLNPNYDPTNVDYAEEHVDYSDRSKIIAKNDETCNLNSSSSSLDDHCHVSVNIENKNRNRVVWYKLITVLILCLIFMVGEIVGGILAKSISIQTDAAHMAADIAGFFFSIVAIYVSEKEPTRRMSFGYYRSEVLGALFSILIIWILTGILVYLAIVRCITNDFEIEPIAMVATASCGVFFNIVMFFVLHTNKCFGHFHNHGHGHSHGHGHRHGHGDEHENSHGHSHGASNHHKTAKKSNTFLSASSNHNHNHSHSHSHSRSESSSSHTGGSTSIPINDNYLINSEDVTIIDEASHAHNKKDSSNINLRAAAIHVIGDFIQSVGVLCASIIILIKPEYKIADPICTFIFSTLVILTTAPIIKDIYFVLMEALPVHINYTSIAQDLTSLTNVKNAHNLHIWCLTMDKLVLAVHLVTEKDIDTQQVLREAQSMLRTKYKIERTIIQVEYFVDGMEGCPQCKLPQLA